MKKIQMILIIIIKIKYQLQINLNLKNWKILRKKISLKFKDFFYNLSPKSKFSKKSFSLQKKQTKQPTITFSKNHKMVIILTTDL